MEGEVKRIKLSHMSHTYLRILLAALVLGCSQAQKPICTVNKLNTTGIHEGEAIVVHPEAFFSKRTPYLILLAFSPFSNNRGCEKIVSYGSCL